jgi:predicted ATPase
VITSVRIKAFRGVREGLLEGLSPLSILVGPNNAGKSTCLEAIAIVGLGSDATGVAALMLRRGGPPHDALEHVIAEGEKSYQIEASANQGETGKWASRASVGAQTLTATQVKDRGLEGAQVAVVFVEAEETTRRTFGQSRAFVDTGGRLSIWHEGGAAVGFPVRLVDVEAVRIAGALEDAYSRLERAGRVEQVVHALQRSMPGLTDLRILKSGPDFILHALLGKGRPVPAYTAGDGFKRFLELAASSLDVERGVVLLEEPEAYQHPRYLRELTSLLHQAAKGGMQVILSTHSIELIDLLLHAPEADGLDYPTVHRLRLVDGRLSATGLSRSQAITTRDELLEDLRA